jgi:hypothetical protein
MKMKKMLHSHLVASTKNDMHSLKNKHLYSGIPWRHMRVAKYFFSLTKIKKAILGFLTNFRLI